MVGVPHSTGCALCLERHIKCDEAVPECSQCRRYGRACPGYRRTFRFQDEGPTLERRNRSGRPRASRRATSRQRGQRASAGPVTPTSATTVTPPNYAAGHTESRGEDVGAAAMVRRNAIALMRRHASVVPLDESVSPSLVRQTLKAAQPRLFIDFISASFPTLYFHNRFRSGSDPGFAEFIVLNFGQDAFMDSAICCLSLVYLAHLTQNSALRQASGHMYADSLREMIRALPKNARAMSDNMLCTTMMLSVYEMYAQTRPDAWVVHSNAVKTLMTSRGTAAHMSGFGRSCWIAFRGFHVATAVYEGKPCFLDEPEWQLYSRKIMAEDGQKHGDWAEYAVISDRVFMEIAKCPRYISDGREILAAPDEKSRDAAEALIGRIQDTARNLSHLVAELRVCISAHSQRQQGIVCRPDTFIGPVPEIFPDTGPSLLLRGAENIQDTLHQVRGRLKDKLYPRAIEELTPESMPTPNDGSVDTPSPPATTQNTFSLPFRIHSELGLGPSQTSDPDDPRAVIWLDRVASSMGVLGTKLVDEVPAPIGYVEEESPET
ncbi:hypothetical protein N7492_005691 [Penicillium capsulatum]|uniref:Zn(2)-C6 fungal-type domain-containing protein n=1 Tax=Penicillium capsulatum TaxID=69766 RepID=A0A9W9ICC1_9EURO|nr:hypothetical protein N7492_005691 [Penicillium capsulatum]KAJ6135211.1 hypothetical protein N7512_000371 [Penicillium capsulatum]